MPISVPVLWAVAKTNALLLTTQERHVPPANPIRRAAYALMCNNMAEGVVYFVVIANTVIMLTVGGGEGRGGGGEGGGLGNVERATGNVQWAALK